MEGGREQEQTSVQLQIVFRLEMYLEGKQSLTLACAPSAPPPPTPMLDCI